MSWHRKQFRPLKPIPRWEQPRDPCKPQGCVGVDRPFAWAKLKMQAVCRFSYAPQKQHFNDCSYCIDEIRRINTSERAKLSSFLDIFCAVFCWTAWCTRNNNQKVHSKLHLQKRVKMRSRPASFFPLRGSGFQAGRRLRYVTTTADTFSRPPPEKKSASQIMQPSSWRGETGSGCTYLMRDAKCYAEAHNFTFVSSRFLCSESRIGLTGFWGFGKRARQRM